MRDLPWVQWLLILLLLTTSKNFFSCGENALPRHPSLLFYFSISHLQKNFLKTFIIDSPFLHLSWVGLLTLVTTEPIFSQYHRWPSQQQAKVATAFSSLLFSSIWHGFHFLVLGTFSSHIFKNIIFSWFSHHLTARLGCSFDVLRAFCSGWGCPRAPLKLLFYLHRLSS